MATTRPRPDDLATATDKARRGKIDDTTATPAILDVPDVEILDSAGLTAEEARRLVQGGEMPAARRNGARRRRTKRRRPH